MNKTNNYPEDLNNKSTNYWFKRKLYGWGWTPSTWQGWAITLIYIILIFSLSTTINEQSPEKEVLLSFIFPFFLLTVAFIRIAYKKGEKPCWQWGRTKK